LNAAGDLTIRDFSDDQFYVLSCILILNSYYGQQFDYNKPLFYDIPNSDGIISHYRILYNVDFIEITLQKTVPLTSTDIDELMDNYGNIDLWKRNFL
jgi:hypothetical protein